MDQDLTIYPDRHIEVSDVIVIEKIIAEWMNAKASRSKKTEEAYSLIMYYFRKHLHAVNLDVFDNKRAVASVIRSYVRTSYDRRGRVRNGKLSEGTINQRLAIISSFYIFCQKQIDDRIDNPVNLCERENQNVHDAAHHIETSDVEKALQSIDRTTLAGKRDYAILLLALTTGRRSSELVSIQLGDLRPTGKKVQVTWRHCKGNKTMHDVLGINTREALDKYLIALYGPDFATLPEETPIFVSFSHNNTGKILSSQAVANICLKYLGTSKVHSTRHTFAVTSETAGLSLSEIGERLGHTSLNTTAVYMQRLHSDENKQIHKIESLYGL